MSATATRPRRPAPLQPLGGDSRFYDLVALGLAAYGRARFRVRVVGAPFALAPRRLVVATHRAHTDVPVLIAALYRSAHGLVRHGPPVHFVVRDDLFEPGFFAGYPPRLPRALRRLLWGIDIGPVLRRGLPCHPISPATRLRLVQLLRAVPEAPLDGLLPAELLAPLRERGRRLGEAPSRSGDVLSGDYADLLWRIVDREELPEGSADDAWHARRGRATADFRELVDVLRSGASMLLTPEGRPSPDGSIGPLMGGIGPLVRRGEVESLIAIAPSYDPLVAGRTRVDVGVSAPVQATADPDEVLALLRRTTPLTVGASLAAALADGDDPGARLAADVEAARADGRPCDASLDDGGVRAARLADARRAAEGRDLSRLAAEYRSARA